LLSLFSFDFSLLILKSYLHTILNIQSFFVKPKPKSNMALFLMRFDFYLNYAKAPLICWHNDWAFLNYLVSNYLPRFWVPFFAQVYIMVHPFFLSNIYSSMSFTTMLNFLFPFVDKNL